MAKSNQLIWRLSVLFPLLAVISSFGFFALSGKRSQASVSSSTALIAQPDEAFQNVITQWEREVKEKRLTFTIPVQFQAKTFDDVKLNSQEKVIALTFDDGPLPENTPQILEILKNNNIKATFFVVGRMVKEYPQLLQAVVKDGHAIGNHTWSHSYQNFSLDGAASEIDRTDAIIYEATGVKTFLFRPPGGFLHNGVADYAKKQNHAIVMWSADSNDYRRPPVDTFLNTVMREAGPGGIVLMHDGGGDRSQTVAALPQLIAELKDKGYKFVTLPELLKMAEKAQKSPVAAQPPQSSNNTQKSNNN